MKTYVHKKACASMFMAVSFLIARNQKQPTYPSTGWKDKQIMVYPCDWILHSNKEEQITDT